MQNQDSDTRGAVPLDGPRYNNKLRITSLFCIVLLFCFVSVTALDAQTSSKSTAPPAKKTTGKPSQSTTKGKSTRTARRSPPRQTAPTAERYKEIQQALADKGFYTGPVNGEWGSESVTALKNFQEASNIAADGKLGSLSLIALGLGPKREPMNQLAGKPESAP